MTRPTSGPFAQFGTNKEAEQNGIWNDYGTFRLKIRRAGSMNKAFAREMEVKLLKPHGRALGALTDEVSVPILARIYAETIVVDWDSDLGPSTVPDADGKPLKFSVDACAKLFEDVPDFFRLVQNDAANLATFQQEQAEADAKN